jgi:hypothetical protein
MTRLRTSVADARGHGPLIDQGVHRALSLPSGIEWLAAVRIAAIVATGLRLLIPDRDQPRASDAPT